MSFQTSTRLLHFCADRIEQSEKSGLLTQYPAQSPKTLNKKVVDNFLFFPKVIYTPLYDQQFGSYDVLNIDRAAEISGLIRFEQSANFKLLGLVQVQCQKTFNIKLIVNFLHFTVITHTLESNNREEVIIIRSQVVLLKIPVSRTD
jgi:hypothetical protein